MGGPNGGNDENGEDMNDIGPGELGAALAAMPGADGPARHLQNGVVGVLAALANPRGVGGAGIADAAVVAHAHVGAALEALGRQQRIAMEREVHLATLAATSAAHERAIVASAEADKRRHELEVLKLQTALQLNQLALRNAAAAQSGSFEAGRNKRMITNIFLMSIMGAGCALSYGAYGAVEPIKALVLSIVSAIEPSMFPEGPPTPPNPLEPPPERNR